MPTKIFISYKRDDPCDFVNRLRTFLEGKNYDCFIDEQIVGGDPWWQEICDNVRGRSHFIPLISRGYFESPSCMEELHFANRCHSIIIPVRVMGNIPVHEIERKLSYLGKITGSTANEQIQIIDACRDDRNGSSCDEDLDRILDAIVTHLQNNYSERKNLPNPPCPISPRETLLSIRSKLAQKPLTEIDIIIDQLRTISRLEEHRDAAVELLQQLVSNNNGKYLSYHQHDEITDLIQQLTTRLPLAKGGILDASSELGISKLFKDRRGAAEDIADSLDAPETTRIYIMGVSLNNFERAGGEFHRTWNRIQAMVESTSPQTRALDIRILIAHPNSFSSVLRSKGEQEDVAPENRRLTTDVNSTADQLNRLQQRLQARGESSIKLEARLYMTAPVLFLYWTDRQCFVQPYYFWTHHDAAMMPILCFDTKDTSPNGAKLHSDLESHFKLIWDNASVPVDDYLTGRQRGIETAMHQAGAVNVYSSNSEAKQRILYLLDSAREKIWLQGITLFSYFGKDDELTTAFARAVGRKKADGKNLDVKALALNPEGEQAKYRAYREYRIFREQTKRTPIDFAAFIAKNLHQRTRLWRDSESTREGVEMLQAQNPDFQFRLFDSAPYCFMLVVDEHVLIEQYHYGNQPGVMYKGVVDNSLILGKDMPKIEYGPHIPEIFLPVEEAGKNSVTLSKLLENHFEFAFDTAKLPERIESEQPSDDVFDE